MTIYWPQPAAPPRATWVRRIGPAVGLFVLVMVTRLPALLSPKALDDEQVYAVVAREMLHGGRPYLDAIEFSIISNRATSLLAFSAGKFDIAMGGVSITLDRARKGYFSAPYLREGKTPIVRCGDVGRYDALPDIDRPDVRVVVNPGGTNERFARAHFKTAPVRIFPDNRAIFEEIAEGRADVMVTDVSETKYQAKLHPGVLCSAHPERPFDFAEKAYWLQRDAPLKAFVDTWLRISIESGAFRAITQKWMD